MGDNSWLDNFAHSMGVDTSTDNQSTSPYEDHHSWQTQNDHAHFQTQIDQFSPSPEPEPHSWNTTTTSLHSDDSSTSNSDSTYNDISVNSHHHYNSHNHYDHIIGNPDEAIKHFHSQNHPDTCGIAVQRSIIEETTGQNYSENYLMNIAESGNSYHQGKGTSINHLGDVVNVMANVAVDKHFGANLTEIADKINHGEHVMVSVNSEIVNTPDAQSIFGSLSSQMLNNAIQNNSIANHVEEVIGIGINNNDPAHSVIIVNDPSSVNGQGVEIPVEQFLAAWEKGGNFMASTVTHPETILKNPIGANHHNYQNSMDYNVGCKVELNNYNDVWIDNSHVGTYTGNSFYYYPSGKLAGTWSCGTHYTYSATGKNLGYAATKSDAVLLIYKQS